uniref:Uncharacterized protein n=1 Tax=Anguilla anguilla TaxID=7936 RepID=A0A0E9UB60_ANGAN
MFGTDGFTGDSDLSGVFNCLFTAKRALESVIAVCQHKDQSL